MASKCPIPDSGHQEARVKIKYRIRSSTFEKTITENVEDPKTLTFSINNNYSHFFWNKKNER